MRPWLRFTLLRLGFFVAALAALLLIGVDWVMGAVFATLISLALSTIFLGTLRQEVADGLRRRVEKPTKDVDSQIEDTQVDSPED